MNGTFLTIKATRSLGSMCSRRDEAVWNWSHSICCSTDVEGARRGRRVEVRDWGTISPRGLLTGRRGRCCWSSRCETNMMTADSGEKQGHNALNRETVLRVMSFTSPRKTVPTSLFWFLFQTASVLWVLVAPSPLSSHSVPPASPRPLAPPFCFSHPPTLSRHCAVSTLFSPASWRFYHSV